MLTTMNSGPFIFTRAGLREIDRRAVEEFHLPILVLMENAGRAVAEAVLRRITTGERVLVIAGPGNNGGDGLVSARHLHNAGVKVGVLLLAAREKYHAAAGTQLAIVDAMRLPAEVLSQDHAELRDWLVDSAPGDVIVDAMFGTGLSRPAEGLAADAIRVVIGSGHPIIAVDIPSGLDCDLGADVGGTGAAIIRAAETVSFCGLKKGFARAKAFTGPVTIADIGVPVELLRQLAAGA